MGPSGFTLSAKTGAGTMTAAAVVSAAAVTVVSSGPMLAQIVVTGIQALGATETWLLSLAAGDRYAHGFSFGPQGESRGLALRH